MAEPLLEAPSRWKDELRTVAVDVLRLSEYRLEERLPRNWSLTAVEHDLERGAWLAPIRGKQNEFRMGGDEFELRVVARLAAHAKHPMALVLNVDEARSVPRRAGRLVPHRVIFSDLRREERCDIAALADEVARRVAFIDGVGRRGAAQRELERHHELHRLVLREYGDLRALIDLLEQRPAKPTRTVSGLLASGARRGRQQLVVVETAARGLAEFRGKRVRLRLTDGRTFNTRVVRVLPRQLHIAEPQDWSGARDLEVEVAELPPFGMHRNRQALEEFLSGKVEGAWHELARLMCSPAVLTSPPMPPPSRFYCDSDPDAHALNEEQRLAVGKAVGSPHACLVQGPPGTGKTEVISETIQQLVGRGQRVLLLAPAHVAVDEVLQRVGPKPGIRPLRITFDDDKVDEQVRIYLPQNVGVELVDRVLRRTVAGRAEHWVNELRDVERGLAALAVAQSARTRLAIAQMKTKGLEQAADEAQERLESAQAQGVRESRLVEAAIASAERDLARDTASFRGLADTAAELREQWQPLLVATAESAREVIAAADEDLAWTTRADNASYELLSRRREHAELLWQHDAGIAELRRVLTSLREREAHARGAESYAAFELRRVETNSGTWQRLTASVGRGEVAGARRAMVTARFALEQVRAELGAVANQLGMAERRRMEVDGRGRGWLEQLSETADRNQQRARHARAVRIDALRRMATMLAEFGGSAAEALPPDQQAETAKHLAETVLGTIAAVVPAADRDRGDPSAEPSVPEILGGLHDRAGELWRTEIALTRAQEAHEIASARLSEQKSVRDAVVARMKQLDDACLHAREQLEKHQKDIDDLSRSLAEVKVEIDALGLRGTADEVTRLQRRQLVLGHLPALERRWYELVENRTDDELVEDIQASALKATNLVCATTKGIVGRGSDVVRHTDYDTLIVDEASRVTDSEFLIGAVRARRWVLVGDKHQLPPHVDQEDEHFLHALFALYRCHRGAAENLEAAVDHLAEHWNEEVELRRFRGEEVVKQAQELVDNGSWEAVLRTRMDETYAWFAKRAKSDRRRSDADELDPDRVLLRTMNQYLVRSLFERVAECCADGLKQPLKWQRRMAEPLARIVNDPVYRGEYRSPPEEDLAKAGASRLVVPDTFDRPVVFIDTSRYGRAAEEAQARRGNGFENALEQRMVLDACRIYHAELDRMRSQPISVSVLSFYRAQAQALDDALDRTAFPLFDFKVVDVVDRIQGQQADLVLVSFVRAKEQGRVGPRFGSWLQDVRRLTVACTRARRALVLVGHADTLRRLGTTRGAARDAAAEPAVRFYRNLFGLFEDSSEFLMLHKFGRGRRE